MARLVTEYEFDTIYHLAALLSTRGEFAPELAHQVNVEGTLGLMQIGRRTIAAARRSSEDLFSPVPSPLMACPT